MSEASVECVGEMTSSSATWALISRSALADAAAVAVAAGGRIADLRGDAYGHGILPIARAVMLAGARSVVVDTVHDVEMLEAESIPATISDVPDIDPHLLYAIPRADGSGPRPVLRLTGRVLSTKRLLAGDAVSYGYTYRAPVARTVALVTGGYAQGIVRSLGNRAHAEIAGTLCPIIGRVAMDVCVVDLDDRDAAAGDEVTYFGGAGAASAQLLEWEHVTGMRSTELLAVAGQHAIRGEER